MAGVVLANELFGSARLMRFVELTGWSQFEALGRLAVAWRDTQDAGKSIVSRAELLDAFLVFDPPFADRLINALIKSPFIKSIDDGSFLIIGNEKHIEKIDKKRDSGREGGLAKAAAAKAKQELADAKQELAYARNLLADAKQGLAEGQRNVAKSTPSPSPIPNPELNSFPLTPIEIPKAVLANASGCQANPQMAEGPSGSRGPDDSAIEAIMSALQWEGENLKAAVATISKRGVMLLTAYGGTEKYSAGLDLAWRGCRREPNSGLIGGAFRPDAAKLVADNLRRIARRLRSPKENA